jgi:hypothetical protein
MPNLFYACQSYIFVVNAKNTLNNGNTQAYINYFNKKKTKGNKFDSENYIKKHKIDKKNVEEFQNYKKNLDNSCQFLKNYEISTIKTHLKGYDSISKSIANIVTYADLPNTLEETIINKDSLEKSQKVADICVKGSIEAIDKLSKNCELYLSAQDFKCKFDSDEYAMEKFAIFIVQLFFNSKILKNENNNLEKRLSKQKRSILNKINGYENKKVKLVSQGKTADKIADILGSDYILKDYYKENLYPKLSYFYDNLIEELRSSK